MTQSYLVGRRNVHDSPWTGERVELLTLLWGQGFSASQIADQIMDVKVTRMAVIGKAHRLGLPIRKARVSARRAPRKPRLSVPKPPAPPPRPQPPPPPPGALKMRQLNLIQLKPDHCRWPITDVGPPFLFCGADAASGEVYCPFHQRMGRAKDKRE